jgi:hypothetical protein
MRLQPSAVRVLWCMVGLAFALGFSFSALTALRAVVGAAFFFFLKKREIISVLAGVGYTTPYI